jgi:hypothetical protein
MRLAWRGTVAGREIGTGAILFAQIPSALDLGFDAISIALE